MVPIRQNQELGEEEEGEGEAEGVTNINIEMFLGRLLPTYPLGDELVQAAMRGHSISHRKTRIHGGSELDLHQSKQGCSSETVHNHTELNVYPQHCLPST